MMELIKNRVLTSVNLILCGYSKKIIYSFIILIKIFRVLILFLHEFKFNLIYFHPIHRFKI